MIAAVQYNIYNSQTFQARTIPVKKGYSAKNSKVYIPAVITKPAKKETLSGALKEMFYELFPKMDPEYRKIFVKNINQKV